MTGRESRGDVDVERESVAGNEEEEACKGKEE
jgi:hypothetical protein